ncbi:cupredoxin domain-containing protein [Streptomyces sp. NPDC004647]|uniref:cupredoxin domain-containing protein n=1 Tax=Streptomyces sp. NPDC004647 TaxID=3154671 RepID=UPI00339DF74E
MVRTATVTRNAGLGIAAGALAAVLAACGGGGYGDSGDGSKSSPPTRSGETKVTQVNVKMTDFRFQLPEKTFTAGDHTFVARNDGHHEHALEVQGPGGDQRSKTVDPGQTTTLKVTLKNGTYQISCPVGNHTDLGMKTAITVSGGGPSPEKTPSDNPGY